MPDMRITTTPRTTVVAIDPTKTTLYNSRSVHMFTNVILSDASTTKHSLLSYVHNVSALSLHLTLTGFAGSIGRRSGGLAVLTVPAPLDTLEADAGIVGRRGSDGFPRRLATADGAPRWIRADWG